MNKPKLLTLFLSFFKIGLFTIGGGYAMLPLIQREVVEKQKWMDEETFIDGIAAAQTCPGPIAVNLSVYVGFHIAGWSGIALAVLGSILPSFLIILIIALTFNNWSQVKIVQNAFNGLRPAVVALIAVPVIRIAKKSRIKWQQYWLPLVAVVFIVFFHISPVYLIIFTILFSWIRHLYETEMREREGHS